MLEANREPKKILGSARTGSFNGRAVLDEALRSTETRGARDDAKTPSEGHGCVATQGHVLAVPDFLATLVTEAVIHHLDLTVQLTGMPAPDPVAVALTERTLDGLLGPATRRPAAWTSEEYLLKATGRLTLSEADRQSLGPAADRFPLLS